MILFTLLLLTSIIFAIVTVITLVSVGAGFIAIFGDVIVFCAIIVFIIKALVKKGKQKKN